MNAIVASTYCAFMTPFPIFLALCLALRVSSAIFPVTSVYLSCASSNNNSLSRRSSKLRLQLTHLQRVPKPRYCPDLVNLNYEFVYISWRSECVMVCHGVLCQCLCACVRCDVNLFMRDTTICTNTNPRRCKTSSFGQSAGLLIPRSFDSGKTSKTENSNLHGFELHRPSSKGTKLLLQVIKAINNQCETKRSSYAGHRASCMTHLYLACHIHANHISFTL